MIIAILVQAALVVAAQIRNSGESFLTACSKQAILSTCKDPSFHCNE